MTSPGANSRRPRCPVCGSYETSVCGREATNRGSIRSPAAMRKQCRTRSRQLMLWCGWVGCSATWAGRSPDPVPKGRGEPFRRRDCNGAAFVTAPATAPRATHHVEKELRIVRSVAMFIPIGRRSGPETCAENIAASPQAATRPFPTVSIPPVTSLEWLRAASAP
jgi:hypothetical protein